MTTLDQLKAEAARLMRIKPAAEHKELLEAIWQGKVNNIKFVEEQER